MNAAEIKLELFRIIDNLESSKLEDVYSKIVDGKEDYGNWCRTCW